MCTLDVCIFSFSNFTVFKNYVEIPLKCKFFNVYFIHMCKCHNETTYLVNFKKIEEGF